MELDIGGTLYYVVAPNTNLITTTVKIVSMISQTGAPVLQEFDSSFKRAKGKQRDNTYYTSLSNNFNLTPPPFTCLRAHRKCATPTTSTCRVPLAPTKMILLV